jgi:hypothetical protein
MGTVIGLLPVTPSIDQFARIISNVAAPAFLLGAVASFISVVISRINRVIDRLHFIHSIPITTFRDSTFEVICLASGVALSF